VLVGREGECKAIERVLARARAGAAASLVLRAEAGVGKTALLRLAIEGAAASMRVVRATGVESEAELEYSGLLEVCRPLLSQLETLPERQANELRVALALDAGPTPDRFGVGAATLSLLAAAAESEALLVVVDDAQWLDHASASALLFAARRLLADRVAFLFATREDGFDAAGIEELRLAGLGREATAALVERATGRRLAPDAAAALQAATGGNPLALLELSERLEPALLAGGGLGPPLPVTEQIERAFARRLQRLPDTTRRALCVVAAARTEALATPLAAMRRLGLEADVLVPAEDAGLIVVEAATCRFQHPLLRAVAYHDRPRSEQRAAHRALADELDGTASTEQTAWHLASAAVGVDERAADALAAAASSALARGGHSAAAAALERAAQLTPGAALRVDRLADAAELAWNGGESARAAALVEEALASTADVPTRVRLLTLGGRIEFQEGRQARARELFGDVVDLLGDEDPEHTIRMLGFVVYTCFNEGRIAESVEVARRAHSLAAGGPEAAVLHGNYLLGRALLLAGRAEGAPLLTGIVERVREEDHSALVLTRLAASFAALDRVDEAAAAAQRLVALAREEGPPMVLILRLSTLMSVTVRNGSWSQTVAAATEGAELARQLGQDNVLAIFLSVLGHVQAARGEEESCRRNIGEALGVFERSGSGAEAERLRLALALLDLGLDRLPAAVDTLEAVADAVEEMGLYDRDVAPEPELVEALVHVGRRADAGRRLERWLERAEPEATLWAPPLAARCRGLLAGDAEFAGHFERAIELHAGTTDRFQLARTHLAYGQRLRRGGRRVDARPQLRAALDLFERLEAAPWAEQARQELRASGEKLRRAAFAGDELTPQELQIALQVAEGKQNKAVAAAMFLSPKTVEFHLGRIYRKLDIGSRSELVRRYAAGAAPVAA